ncbi:spindle assembly abnormal protein 6 homolog isoform X2 [Actinia tenebrosa]|uniref:Spindle assembly abnormal protein 6 homolog n=1 Tax=Actinia tenebrosa TaxID=6105 RepID=A0A6P8HMM8_ACTTE|nr:spindle assembly abnormal protein 6 homolog isoform X2 [Actinia tenebrosa]
MEEFFNKSVPLFLKHSDHEDRTRVRITVVNRLASSGPQKELAVRLTDDGDPFFLYSLVLTEEDFQSLKNQQGLLVDFGSFPQKFVDLLELCLKEENKDMPKFLLQFVSSAGSYERGVGNLNVIETNPFKHLTHLSLRFLAGNDTEIKKYLADCLKKIKEEKLSLENRLSSTEQDLRQRLESCQEVLNSKSKQLDTLQAEFSAKSNELSNKYAQELTEEKQRILQMKSQTMQEFERERKSLEQSHRNVVKGMENRIAEIEAQNKDLTDKKYQAEAKIRELSTKLSGLEGEYSHMKEELMTLRRGNSVLNSEQHEKDKTLAHLRTRVAVLEQELRDKEQVISRTNELLQAANEQKQNQENVLDQRQKQIQKLENTVQSVSAEVVKGNDIIQRLQTERRTVKSQMKMKSVLVTQQEKVLSEKEKELQSLKKEFETLKESQTSKEEEIKKLGETLKATTEKLEESKELLKTNENVINYLNKQMNDQMITSQQRHGTFELHSSKDPLLSKDGISISKTITPPQALVPRYTNQQVTYRPAAQRKATFPRPLTHSTPTIPEEAEPRGREATPITTPHSRNNIENQPVLDPKYLQRRNHINEVPAKHNDNVPHEKRILQPSVRFGSNARPGAAQPPLMSAYFPKNT